MSAEQLEAFQADAVKAARILKDSGFYANEAAVETAIAMVRRLKVGQNIERIAKAKVRRMEARLAKGDRALRGVLSRNILGQAEAAYEAACDVLYSGEAKA